MQVEINTSTSELIELIIVIAIVAGYIICRIKRVAFVCNCAFIPFLAYIVYLLKITFSPFPSHAVVEYYRHIHRNWPIYNLVPLKWVSYYIKYSSSGALVKNINSIFRPSYT